MNDSIPILTTSLAKLAKIRILASNNQLFSTVNAKNVNAMLQNGDLSIILNKRKNYFVRKCLQIFLFLVLPIKGEYKKMGH